MKIYIMLREKKEAVMWRILSPYNLWLFFHDSTYKPFTNTRSHPHLCEGWVWKGWRAGCMNSSCCDAPCRFSSSKTKASQGFGSKEKQEWVEAGASNSFSAISWRWDRHSFYRAWGEQLPECRRQLCCLWRRHLAWVNIYHIIGLAVLLYISDPSYPCL